MFDAEPKSLFDSLESPMTIYQNGNQPYRHSPLYFKEKTATHGFFETRKSYPVVLTASEVNDYYRKNKFWIVDEANSLSEEDWKAISVALEALGWQQPSAASIRELACSSPLTAANGSLRQDEVHEGLPVGESGPDAT